MLTLSLLAAGGGGLVHETRWFSIASRAVHPRNAPNHRMLAFSLACLAVFLFAWLQYARVSPSTERGILPINPATPYIRFSPDSAPAGTVILVHGLNSNKEFMQSFGMALAESGFQVYAFDLPGHGDSSEPFTFELSALAVERVIDHVGGETLLVGHSLGGALLVDLAPTRSLETLVLLSPAPVAVEALEAGRILVVTGHLDAPRINEFAPLLMDAAGTTGVWWKFPYGAHSSALFDPSKMGMIAGWMGGEGDSIRAVHRYLWLAVMAAAGLIAALALVPKPPPPPAGPDSADPRWMVVSYVAAAGGALIVLRFFVPLAWLGIFAADYLMSFVLVTGLFLWRGHRFRLSRWGILVSVIAVAYVIVVFVLGIGERLFHVIPSGEQWIRVPILATVSFPLFLSDEQSLRGGLSGWRRVATFFLTRLILWAAILTGVLLLNESSSFLVLITHFIVVFWLVLWWMAGFVHRATAEPAAAAMFAALVQGWAFSALFVTI